MAVAAIVAVGHDVAITIGVYALTRIEVSPATVIGFLTILGYSLYDTVVVFDKVRENTLPISIRAANTSISKAANLAVNQTLVRSLSTTLIALLPVLAILFVGVGLMGAGVLKDLAVALFVGLTVGAYSSIFVATPLFVTFSKNAEKIQGVRRTTSPNRRKAAAISDEPTTDNNLFEEVTPLVDDLPVEAVKPQTAPKRNSGSRATRTQGKKNSKGGGRSRK
jgi:preprotein translocase subunit SecF